MNLNVERLQDSVDTPLRFDVQIVFGYRNDGQPLARKEIRDGVDLLRCWSVVGVELVLGDPVVIVRRILLLLLFYQLVELLLLVKLQPDVYCEQRGWIERPLIARVADETRCATGNFHRLGGQNAANNGQQTGDSRGLEITHQSFHGSS